MLKYGQAGWCIHSIHHIILPHCIKGIPISLPLRCEAGSIMDPILLQYHYNNHFHVLYYLSLTYSLIGLIPNSLSKIHLHYPVC